MGPLHVAGLHLLCTYSSIQYQQLNPYPPTTEHWSTRTWLRASHGVKTRSVTKFHGLYQNRRVVTVTAITSFLGCTVKNIIL